MRLVWLMYDYERVFRLTVSENIVNASKINVFRNNQFGPITLIRILTVLCKNKYFWGRYERFNT